MFTVFGFGCNPGASQTASHAPESVNRQTLHRINAQYIDTGKLEAAVADIVNEYIRFELPRFRGAANVAIDDGRQMELREINLLGERHIRYGGVIISLVIPAHAGIQIPRKTGSWDVAS